MGRPKVYKLRGMRGAFRDFKIYHHGFTTQPTLLRDKGKDTRGFTGLKHLLELLSQRFKKFSLTLTPEENSIRKEGGIAKIRISAKAIRQFTDQTYQESRGIKLRLMGQMLAKQFPSEFGGKRSRIAYRKGMLAELLDDKLDRRLLSLEDERALTKFVSGDLGGKTGAKGIDIDTAVQSRQSVQLMILRRLVADFNELIKKGQAEEKWQKYLSKHILLFQDNYIKRIEKLNVAIGTTKFPDFMAVTSDGFLDVLEIKTPDTTLLAHDKSRNNYYWSSKLAMAVSQTENYLDAIQAHRDPIRNELKDKHKVDVRIVRPRGVIIAGSTEQFDGVAKKSADFRLLCEGLKNIEIIPYDELGKRLRNSILGIEQIEEGGTKKKQDAKRAATTNASRRRRR